MIHSLNQLCADTLANARAVYAGLTLIEALLSAMSRGGISLSCSNTDAPALCISADVTAYVSIKATRMVCLSVVYFMCVYMRAYTHICVLWPHLFTFFTATGGTSAFSGAMNSCKCHILCALTSLESAVARGASVGPLLPNGAPTSVLAELPGTQKPYACQDQGDLWYPWPKAMAAFENLNSMLPVDSACCACLTLMHKLIEPQSHALVSCNELQAGSPCAISLCL